MNVVITGTSRGIGKKLLELTLEKAQTNDIVFALSRNIKTIEEFKHKFHQLIPIQCDIASEKQVVEAMNYIKSFTSVIDIVINNAGSILNKSILDTTSNEIDVVFNTNFKAPYLIIKLLFPLLIKSQRAHIVNISSMGGFQGSAKFSGLSVYSASKAALSCLSECLAEEFKSTSIKVNALCIGAVNTEMLNEAFPDYKATLSPKEMAEFIYCFMIRSHHFMNGKVIPVSLSTP